MEIREGYMPFLEYKTYYRVVGKNTGNKKPLVLLHVDLDLLITILKYWTVLRKRTEDSW